MRIISSNAYQKISGADVIEMDSYRKYEKVSKKSISIKYSIAFESAYKIVKNYFRFRISKAELIDFAVDEVFRMFQQNNVIFGFQPKKKKFM